MQRHKKANRADFKRLRADIGEVKEDLAAHGEEARAGRLAADQKMADNHAANQTEIGKVRNEVWAVDKKIDHVGARVKAIVWIATVAVGIAGFLLKDLVMPIVLHYYGINP